MLSLSILSKNVTIFFKLLLLLLLFWKFPPRTSVKNTLQNIPFSFLFFVFKTWLVEKNSKSQLLKGLTSIIFHPPFKPFQEDLSAPTPSLVPWGKSVLGKFQFLELILGLSQFLFLKLGIHFGSGFSKEQTLVPILILKVKTSFDQVLISLN